MVGGRTGDRFSLFFLVLRSLVTLCSPLNWTSSVLVLVSIFYCSFISSPRITKPPF